MIWADFFPYVLPAVPNCPDPVLEHHVRLAAIEFCRRTLCWQQILDPIEGETGAVAYRLTEDGDYRITEDGAMLTTEGGGGPVVDGVATEFDMVIPEGAEVVKVLSVAVNGDDVTVVEGSRGVQLTRRGVSADFAYTRDRRKLVIRPAPRAGSRIDVEAALKPSLDAVEFPDELFDQYVQDIAHGALAGLMLVPGQDWSNPTMAAIHQDSFDDRIGTVAAQVERGFGRSKRRGVVAHWF